MVWSKVWLRLELSWPAVAALEFLGLRAEALSFASPQIFWRKRLRNAVTFLCANDFCLVGIAEILKHAQDSQNGFGEGKEE